jgi:hypothetical protein
MNKNMVLETLIQTVLRINALKKDQVKRFRAELLQGELRAREEINRHIESSKPGY